MPFIKLTRWDGDETYLVDFSCDMMLVSNDDGTTECRSPRAYSFKESLDQIQAAIAEAEGAPADDETPLDEVRAHLGAALSQVGPSDDQIIVDHIRAAYALLRARRQP